MKQIVCAVYDRQAECFGRPVFTAAIGLAVRSFTDEVNRPSQDNPMWLHPDDYTLYQIGVYDDQEGSFDPFGRPEKVSSGTSVKVRE